MDYSQLSNYDKFDNQFHILARIPLRHKNPIEKLTPFLLQRCSLVPKLPAKEKIMTSFRATNCVLRGEDSLISGPRRLRSASLRSTDIYLHYFSQLGIYSIDMIQMCINTEKCCECGSCAHFCKQHGIDFDYVARKYVIDQQRCIRCETCKDYCPIDNAIIKMEVVQPLAVM